MKNNLDPKYIYIDKGLTQEQVNRLSLIIKILNRETDSGVITLGTPQVTDRFHELNKMNDNELQQLLES